MQLCRVKLFETSIELDVVKIQLRSLFQFSVIISIRASTAALHPYFVAVDKQFFAFCFAFHVDLI